MAVLKCKMCGGDLHFEPGEPIAVCEYCLSRQTIPHQDDEKKLTLFARADRLRRACEFDKAAGIYANITGEFPEEAEAYWGLVLCNYGIEYVDDPATGKKIPTCHRSSFVSILEDSDFEQACENADPAARRVYREEAKTIENIRRGILEISGKEEPYDIFICYKETDENGERTVDSVLAQDVYDALTEKGYRVFFSRVTLETVLGAQYEPYIFAALNSARIMLVFGTDYEYFNAVWVKNEWSRFLAHIASGQKKALIPCYKGIDPYDMPKEFVRLQAQDMGKVGALQDLLRGVDKIMGGGAEKAAAREQEIPRADSSAGVSQLIQRGYFCLEDQDWEKARELFDQALNLDPKCADAYFGLAMADNSSPTRESFGEKYVKGQIAADAKNIKRARQFASTALNEVFEKLDRKKELRDEKQEQWREKQKRAISMSHLIAAGHEYLVRVNPDGTVSTKALGREKHPCHIAQWTDIIAVCAEYNKPLYTGSNYIPMTIGLKANGTVVMDGPVNEEIRKEVSSWRNIIAISAGNSHIVGLKKDGTVVAAGDNKYGQCEVDDWTNIVGITVDDDLTAVIKADGKIEVLGSIGSIGNTSIMDCFEWTDIVSLALGRDALEKYFIGLKADGTVVSKGPDEDSRSMRDSKLRGKDRPYYVHNWTDIVAIATGWNYTFGLKSDGTVVAQGYDDKGQSRVTSWQNIIAIVAGPNYVIGLKQNGMDMIGEFDSDIDSTENREPANNIQNLENQKKKERVALQKELASLPLLFSGKRRREIEARLAEIEQDLSEI